MKLTEILESVDKDILTEDTLTRIQEAFDATVASKVESQLQLQVENALIEMDEDHSAKLESLVAAIDEDHTQKLEQVVESVEADHMAKLKTVIKKYETEANEGAQHHLDNLTEEIDRYLTAYVEELIPTELVETAAKNTYAAKLLGEAKSVLSVDEKFASKQFKEAVQDGANQIDTLTERNEKLERQVSAQKAKTFLEHNTTNMPSAKGQFIRKRLTGKPLNFIKENFKFVANMYEEKAVDTSAALNNAPRIPNVDRDEPTVPSGEQLIGESVETPEPIQNADNPYIDVYMEGMHHSR